ncbi:MAG: hypothetical protein ACJ8HF_08995, partial [Pseudomonas sp.]
GIGHTAPFGWASRQLSVGIQRTQAYEKYKRFRLKAILSHRRSRHADPYKINKTKAKHTDAWLNAIPVAAGDIPPE